MLRNTDQDDFKKVTMTWHHYKLKLKKGYAYYNKLLEKKKTFKSLTQNSRYEETVDDYKQNFHSHVFATHSTQNWLISPS